MYRIIIHDHNDTVDIGFDNSEECEYYWNNLGFSRNNLCLKHGCAGQENANKRIMESSLFLGDYFSPPVNCVSFIQVPKKAYNKVSYLFGTYK